MENFANGGGSPGQIMRYPIIKIPQANIYMKKIACTDSKELFEILAISSSFGLKTAGNGGQQGIY